jgi:hypothetical protein
MIRSTAKNHNQETVAPPVKIRGIKVQEGESVLLVAHPQIAAVWPKFLLTLGVYWFWHRRNTWVLTDRRVLIGKGMISRTEHSIPLRSVNDAVYQRRGPFGYCEIASVRRGRPDVQRVGPLSIWQAHQFAQEIVDRT